MFTCKNKTPGIIALLGLVLSTITALRAAEFEGRIRAAFSRGGETEPWLYTVGTNFLRVETTGSTQPEPVDILNRETGELTLLFPHNRSFVKLKPQTANDSARPPGRPTMPMAAPAAMPQMPAMPAGAGMIPPMPMPGENLELTATGEKTNLLGYLCEKFEFKQRGQVMEIWATKHLFPFQHYVRYQPPRFGPRMIEEQWGDLLTAKKLFPLRAVLKFEMPSAPGSAPPPPGPEQFHFEVQSVTPAKLKPADTALFALPPEYQEIPPLPF